MYTPMHWYWAVGDDTATVFSTDTMSYVPVDDSAFVTWSQAPTLIGSSELLFGVLIDQWMPPYLAAGMQLESTGMPALNGTYSMDLISQQQITGIATSIAAGRGLPGGDVTFVYQGHSFDEASFLNFASAAADFVYATYQTLGQIVIGGVGSLPPQPVVIP